MRSLLHVLDNIGDWSGKIISPLLAVIIVILIYEIGMRYIFNAPTNWAHESSQYLFATYALLSGAYTFRHRLHVNMDMVYNRFSPRMKAIVDLFTSLLALCFIVSFLWWGGLTALESVQLREISTTNWGPPLYPVKIMLPLGAALLLLQWLAKFIRDLITAFTPKEET